MPPSFFLMAHSLAPYSTGTANCGTSLLSMTLTRSVKADRKRDPASAEPWATNERRWPRRRPSGPPEAPAWKDKIPFQTSSSSELTAGTTDPSGGSGRLRFSGSEGCFSFKALSVSPSWGAKPSAEASSLTAPLTSPSANLSATLLLRVSSPPRTPYLILRVTCTTGRSVFSKNWATCCLTSVGRETCLPPPDSPGHLKPQWLKDKTLPQAISLPLSKASLIRCCSASATGITAPFRIWFKTFKLWWHLPTYPT